MPNEIRFHINRTNSINGPSIFGLRLKNALIDLGWHWDSFLPSVSFIVSSGIFRPFAKNILRLDGLYFDLANTLGDSDNKNKPLIKIVSSLQRKSLKTKIGSGRLYLNCPKGCTLQSILMFLIRR